MSTTTVHREDTVANYRALYEHAKSVIKGNIYRNDFTLEDYALSSGYSKRQVQRALAWFDTSWREIYLTERVAHAKTLLQTDLPWADITRRIGYMSAERASDAFKRHEGITPQQFKEMVK